MSRHIRIRQSKQANTVTYEALEPRTVLAGWSVLAAAGNLPMNTQIVESLTSSQTESSDGLKANGLSSPVLMGGSATVQSGHVYYNNTTFSQGTNGFLNAVDYYRVMARENDGVQLLDFVNMTNAASGINALMFNIDQLASSSLSSADFKFQWSPQGDFDVRLEQNRPGNWESIPFAPSEILVSPGGGALSRVRLHWQNNQIENRWLRVTVFANQNTGLGQDEVFYIGHLRGDISIAVTSNKPGQPHGRFVVNNRPDVSFARTRLGESVFVSSTLDLNKNGYVEVDDIGIIRENLGRSLSNIQIQRQDPLRNSTEVNAGDRSKERMDSGLALWSSSFLPAAIGSPQAASATVANPPTVPTKPKVTVQAVDQVFAQSVTAQLPTSLIIGSDSQSQSETRKRMAPAAAGALLTASPFSLIELASS